MGKVGRPKRKAPALEEMTHLTWVEDHVAASSLAYKENNSSDADDEVKLSEGWQHYKTIDNPNGIRYKIWVSPKNGNVMVSFRGASSMKEAKISATLGSTVFKSATGLDIGHTYKGFGDAWNQIKEQLSGELRYLKDTSFIKDGSALQFAGHSLGGAMSDIASTYYADMYPNVQVIVSTLGAPTSGDKNFVNYASHQHNVKRVRIISPGDPIANTILPGMAYMPTPYTIDVGLTTGKKPKPNLYDVFSSLAPANPALNLLLGAKNQMDQHSLDNYAAKLTHNFKAQTVQSVDSDTYHLHKQEDTRIKLRDSALPVSSALCQCECHNYDESVTQGLPPPQSLGTIQRPGAAAINPLQITDSMQQYGQAYNGAGDLIDVMPQDALNKTADEGNQMAYSIDPEQLQSAVNAAIEKQSAKEEQDLNKLEDKYAMLTNQDIVDADPVTKSREAFKRHDDDMQYFDKRIQEELDNPSTVPFDDPTDPSSGTSARDGAIWFKNSLNQLFSTIMSSQSREDGRQLDTNLADFDNNQNQVNANTFHDQDEQMAAAAQDGVLDAEHQTTQFVFDYKLLGDLLNPSVQAKAQIDEWLTYPGMTTDVLYNALKTQAVEDYKTRRLDQLMFNDNQLKADSVNDIREKISKQQGDLRLLSQQRDGFASQIMDLAQSTELGQLITTGIVSVDKLISKFDGTKSATETVNSILGYDPQTHTQILNEQLNESIRELDRQNLGQVERGTAMEGLHSQFDVLEEFPWLSREDVAQLYTEFPEAGPERDKAILELATTKSLARGDEWAATDDRYQVEVDLNKNAQYNFDERDALHDGNFVDGVKEMQDRLDSKYSNAESLKELFKEWNKNDNSDESNLTNVITNGLMGGPLNPMFWTSMYRGYEDMNTGWFDKDGNKLGMNASPDFLRWVGQHPEAGIHYKNEHDSILGQILDPVMSGIDDATNATAALAMGAEFGMPLGPQDVTDTVSSLIGTQRHEDAGTNGVLDGYVGSYNGPKSNGGSSETSTALRELANMAAMYGMGKLGARTMAKEEMKLSNKAQSTLENAVVSKVKGETTGRISQLTSKLQTRATEMMNNAGQKATTYMNERFDSAAATVNRTTANISTKFNEMRNRQQGFTGLVPEVPSIPRVPRGVEDNISLAQTHIHNAGIRAVKTVQGLPSRVQRYTQDASDRAKAWYHRTQNQADMDWELAQQNLHPTGRAPQGPTHLDYTRRNVYNNMI